MSKNQSKFSNHNNTIYIAGEQFKYPKYFNKNGSISFVFSENLILTKKGQANRSRWELPIELHPDNGVKLTYNPPKKWSTELNKAILKSANIGQEFVFYDVDSKVEDWCVNLIKHSTVTD